MCCLKKRMIAVAVMAIGLSGAALAESPAERVRQINEEIAVLSAQLAKLELEAKVAAKETEKLRASAAGVPGVGSPGTDEVPVVRAIDGMDGKLVATLGMRGGVIQTVREGEKFGAWTTKTITVTSVTLARGKETIRVPFGNEPPVASGPVGSSGVPSVGGPLMPPVGLR